MRYHKPQPLAKDNQDLDRAKRAAFQLYGNRSDVVGISSGTKYVRHKKTRRHDSIQFFVTKKLPLNKLDRRPLPAFIYGRFKNGKINRKLKFHTDIIEVGAVKAVCGAGSKIFADVGLRRQNGAITLLFQNKSGNSSFFVVSCAHVLGDLSGDSERLEIRSNCFPDTRPFAHVVFSAQPQHSTFEYDIAIAEVNSECRPLLDLATAKADAVLGSFMPVSEIAPNLRVNCGFPASHIRTATIQSERGSLDVEYDEGIFTVQNAWMIQTSGRAKSGDSGGIIYKDDVAIGMVFAASSEGFAWFHPLATAFEYVQANVNFGLACFSTA